MKSPRYLQARRNLSSNTRRRVYAFDDGMCVYCGSQERLSLDHVVPLSTSSERWFIGVVNHQTNLVTACISCNSQRSTAEHEMMRYGRFFAHPTAFVVYAKRTVAALDVLQQYFLKHQGGQVDKWEKKMRRLEMVHS